MLLISRFIEFLLAILLLIGLIAAIVMLVRRRGEAGEDPGIGTVRRMYLYGLAFAGLLAAGIGGVLLLKTLLDALFGPRAIAVGNTPLALGLALTVVGTPVWLLFWGLAQKSLRQSAVEVRAVSRKVYLYLVLGGSAVTSSTGAIMFLRWAFGSGEFSGTPPALAVVWSGVWAFHWLVEDREAQPIDLALSIRRVYLYLLTTFGLVLLAIGIGVVLRMALGSAYHELFGGPALLAGSYSIWSRATQTALAMALVGLGVWWWHWHRLARRDFESSLRQIYLYLFAVLAGAATVVASLSALLYHLLQWFIGRPETSSPLLHFDVVPGLIAAVTVGGGMWGYHRAVVREEVRVPIPGRTLLPEVQERVQVARRVYGYLVSAVGMVTLGVGLVVLFATAIGLLAPASGRELTGDDPWRNPLVLSITLLLVGVPVWGLYWRDIQQVVALDGPEERARLSRRVFIFLIFGLSVLLTLVNLSIVLFRVLDTVLGDGLPSNLLAEVRWSIAILLTAGAVSIYYWLVLQEDRKAAAGVGLRPAPAGEAAGTTVSAPAQARARKSVTVLVAAGELALVRRLEERLGYSVQAWQRLESRQIAPEVSENELAEVERQIRDADSDRVLLLRAGQVVQVVPYRSF